MGPGGSLWGQGGVRAADPPPPPRSGPERIYRLYEGVSYNCFLAAGLYALLGGFALCQGRLHKRKEYMVR